MRKNLTKIRFLKVKVNCVIYSGGGYFRFVLFLYNNGDILISFEILFLLHIFLEVLLFLLGLGNGWFLDFLSSIRLCILFG